MKGRERERAKTERKREIARKKNERKQGEGLMIMISEKGNVRV